MQTKAKQPGVGNLVFQTLSRCILLQPTNPELEQEFGIEKDLDLPAGKVGVALAERLATFGRMMVQPLAPEMATGSCGEVANFLRIHPAR